jgi:hypothetical protein
MKKFFSILGLEVYALGLAFFRYASGVMTDEAKYLLNIPYPHPPLARWIIHLTDGWQYHEIFWRIVFATLTVQSVWLILALARKKQRGNESSLPMFGAVLWLFSLALVTQAGTVMMAVLTALQGLVFVLLTLHGPLRRRTYIWVALFWLASVFTNYQVALYLPLVAVIFWRAPLPRRLRLFYIGAPLLLLTLYSATNPLALVSMVGAASKDASRSLLERFWGVIVTWFIAGSSIGSIVGTAGIVHSRRWDLLLSLLLVAAYIWLSYRGYYALLFLPLFVGGAFSLPLQNMRHVSFIRAEAAMIAFVLFFLPPIQKNLARDVTQILAARGVFVQKENGAAIIVGSFGHEWQYYSPYPVFRYTPRLLGPNDVIMCLDACPAAARRLAKRELLEPVPVFVRRLQMN